MEQEKIKSPKTNRYINIYGDAYNKLLKEGYTNDYLLSLPRTTNISSPKRLTKSPKTIQNKGTFSNLKDTDQLILSQAENLYLTCQTNKYLYQLCMANPVLKEKFKIHQQIDKKVNTIIDKLTSTRKLSAYIKWIDKGLFYVKSGDIFKDGQFHVNYQYNYNDNDKNYLITQYKQLKNGQLVTRKELYNILFTVYVNHPYNRIDVDYTRL
jgi:hypothetical protein